MMKEEVHLVVMIESSDSKAQCKDECQTLTTTFVYLLYGDGQCRKAH